MTTSRDISFSSAELNLADKGAAMYWPEPGDGSSDFFDQFVMLEGIGDSHAAGNGEDGSPQFEDINVSPPTSTDPALSTGDPSLDGNDLLSMASSHSQANSVTRQQDSSRGLGPTGAGAVSGSTAVVHPEYLKAVRRYDKQGGGSISDSELLKLEGLSMLSPQVVPPQAAASSVPTSPIMHAQFALEAPSAKRPGRFESIYSTIRKVATRATRPRLQEGNPLVSTAPLGMAKAAERPTEHNIRFDRDQLPASPPRSGRLPAADTSFITGLIEDPFFDHTNTVASSARSRTYRLPDTPLDTPLPDHSNIFGASSAWPAETAELGTDTTLWDPQDELPGGLPTSQEEWWECALDDTMDLTGDFAATNATTNARNATLNLAMHLQHGELPYTASGTMARGEAHSNTNKGSSYNVGPNGMGDLANTGLMIHMPQPRQPTAAILQPALPAGGRTHLAPPPPPLAAPGTMTLPPGQTPAYPRPQARQHPHAEQQAQQHRRHKPRAPSSGARHHHHYGGSMTSPRKVREQQQQPPPSSSSSPSPTPGHARPHHHHQSRRSTSLTSPGGVGGGGGSTGPAPAAVRKRRSWSSQQQRRGGAEPRTPGGGGSSSGSSSGGGGGGGGAGGGFVNFTPEDHGILMTGVAPSGSSKTKARREKEAMERQRKLGEAFLKAVTAAGGDVNKLKAEGIRLGV